MAKIIEYTRSSFKSALELAESVSYLGGNCSVQTCADNMGLQVSGSFRATIAAAQKFGLIDHSKGTLNTTQLYKEIKFSYTDEQKREHLIKSFLSVPLFNKVYERFKGKELPINIINKLLVKEYNVENPEMAQKVGNYFIDGCQTLGLIDNNKLVDISLPKFENNSSESDEGDTKKMVTQGNIKEATVKESTASYLTNSSKDYIINISGPGMNVTITVNDEDDISMVEITMNKIKKILSKRELSS